MLFGQVKGSDREGKSRRRKRQKIYREGRRVCRKFIGTEEFSYHLRRATSERERIMVIRDFPIPNTKEDILEFEILASTHINENRNLDAELLKWKKLLDEGVITREQFNAKKDELLCN